MSGPKPEPVDLATHFPEKTKLFLCHPQFFNLLLNPFEIAVIAVRYVNLLVIDLKFTEKLNLSSIFSIL